MFLFHKEAIIQNTRYKMEKPITLMIEEFRRDIVTIINNSVLPAFAVDMVLKDISRDVSYNAKALAEQEKQNYLLSLNDKEEK